MTVQVCGAVAGAMGNACFGSKATAALTPIEPSGAYRSSRSEEVAGDRNALAQAAVQAYEAGKTVSFAELFAGENRRRIPLPGYPFQRRRYWIE